MRGDAKWLCSSLDAGGRGSCGVGQEVREVEDARPVRKHLVVLVRERRRRDERLEVRMARERRRDAAGRRVHCSQRPVARSFAAGLTVRGSTRP